MKRQAGRKTGRNLSMRSIWIVKDGSTTARSFFDYLSPAGERFLQDAGTPVESRQASLLAVVEAPDVADAETENRFTHRANCTVCRHPAQGGVK